MCKTSWFTIDPALFLTAGLDVAQAGPWADPADPALAQTKNDTCAQVRTCAIANKQYFQNIGILQIHDNTNTENKFSENRKEQIYVLFPRI